MSGPDIKIEYETQFYYGRDKFLSRPKLTRYLVKCNAVRDGNELCASSKWLSSNLDGLRVLRWRSSPGYAANCEHLAQKLEADS
jgi:hypothetical protein